MLSHPKNCKFHQISLDLFTDARDTENMKSNEYNTSDNPRFTAGGKVCLQSVPRLTTRLSVIDPPGHLFKEIHHEIERDDTSTP